VSVVIGSKLEFLHQASDFHHREDAAATGFLIACPAKAMITAMSGGHDRCQNRKFRCPIKLKQANAA
jgi:hypothetical protein